MNTALALDTHKTIQRLMEKGYTQEQAEGFVEAIAESELITKSYLDKSQLEQQNRLIMWVVGMGMAQLFGTLAMIVGLVL